MICLVFNSLYLFPLGEMCLCVNCIVIIEASQHEVFTVKELGVCLTILS